MVRVHYVFLSIDGYSHNALVPRSVSTGFTLVTPVARVHYVILTWYGKSRDGHFNMS